VSIPAEPVEQLVTEALFTAIDTPQLAEAVEEDFESDSHEAMAELLAIEQRLDEQADLFARGAITARQAERISRALQARGDAARAQLTRHQRDTALTPYTGRAGALRADWEGDRLTLEQKRQILASVIEHISVRPATKRGRYASHVDRLDIVWRV
jgi:hypothetical protein